MPKSKDFDHILDNDGVQAVEYEQSNDTVLVLVTNKEPEDQLHDDELVRNVIEHPNTNVIGVGNIEAESGSAKRPVPIGVSEAHVDSTAGTGGPVAKYNDRPSTSIRSDYDGQFVRLSNAHVYALAGDAELGDAILQPGPADGGEPDNTIGQLVGYAELSDGARSDVAIRSLDVTDETNHVIDNDTLGTGVFRGDPQELMQESVVKRGRTTGITRGNVVAVDASVNVSYGDRTIKFDHQIITGDMSDGGDSGSAVYRQDDGEIVGLLFAGSSYTTVMNHISAVEHDIGVTIYTDPLPQLDTDEGQERTEKIKKADTVKTPYNERQSEYVAGGKTTNPHMAEPFAEIDLTSGASAQIAESEYHNAVRDWLEMHYDEIKHEYHFEANRYADFIAQAAPDRDETDWDESQWQAIEVENSFGSITGGVGQAIQYAGLWEMETGHANTEPIVFLPNKGVQQPELAAIQRRCSVVIFPVK